ncbi:MAG: hypothetical protein AAGF73_07500 [Actinomycetota bacterium]
MARDLVRLALLVPPGDAGGVVTVRWGGIVTVRWGGIVTVRWGGIVTVRWGGIVRVGRDRGC